MTRKEHACGKLHPKVGRKVYVTKSLSPYKPTSFFWVLNMVLQNQLIWENTPKCYWAILSVVYGIVLFSVWFGLVCVVYWHLVSVRTFGVMYDHTFSELANHQLRHLATHKVGCQSGDCIWSLRFSSGVCVGTYGLTYSLYHPRGLCSVCCEYQLTLKVLVATIDALCHFGTG